MLANDFLVSLAQAATPSEQIFLDGVNNLPDIFYHSLLTNVTPAEHMTSVQWRTQDFSMGGFQ